MLDLLERCGMSLLRYLIFSSFSTRTWCYAACCSPACQHGTWCFATWSSRASQHDLDAKLLDLLLQIRHGLDATLDVLPCVNMELDATLLCCISAWVWCRATWSSLALQHELDATLLDLLLRFSMNLMLRCLFFSCMSAWYLMLRFLIFSRVSAWNLMLCYLIFSWIPTWTWC